MLSSRPVPPSVHLTPAQRATLLQTSPTLSPTPPPANHALPQLPPTGVLVGRSPSGNVLPKRQTSKVVIAQPQPAIAVELPHEPHIDGAVQHDSRITHAEPAANTPEPTIHAQLTTANDPSSASSTTPTDATATTATTSSTASDQQSFSSAPKPHSHHSSFQRPEPLPSTSPRVTEHQQPLIDALYEAVHAVGVGHWQGLTTQQRKDIAEQLCREHLFNPQPGTSKDSRTTVQWHAQASWTEYDVWVTCVRNVSPYYQGDTYITTYTAHFDQVGRLVEFDERDTKGKKNCVVQ